MPIIGELLNEASWQDLHKIYRDAPPWLLAPFNGQAEHAAGYPVRVNTDRSSAPERYTPRLNFEFD
jgi:hypothetical protein